MKTKAVHPVSSSNLSHAWMKAFLATLSAHPCSPIAVTVSGFSGELPDEDPAIRAALDRKLKDNGKVCTEDTAFTIFPYSTWLRYRQLPRSSFFDRYRRMYPRLLARDKQKYGTYFHRLINYDGLNRGLPKVVNQLDHIIDVWRRDSALNKRSRFSALQASLLDPAKDHTGQPVRGFPCLQQVGFNYDNSGGLAVCAFYPTQYMFERAYGNYLGLCHLGMFMAHEMGLKFSRLDAYIAAPILSGDIAKRKLQDLASIAFPENDGKELQKAS